MVRIRLRLSISYGFLRSFAAPEILPSFAIAGFRPPCSCRLPCGVHAPLHVRHAWRLWFQLSISFGFLRSFAAPEILPSFAFRAIALLAHAGCLAPCLCSRMQACAAQARRKSLYDKKAILYRDSFSCSFQPDSNRRPMHYECIALPTVL